MKRKITRRGAMTIATGAALGAALAPAQVAQAPTARELNQRSGDALAKFEIPLSTEPAFQFRA